MIKDIHHAGHEEIRPGKLYYSDGQLFRCEHLSFSDWHPPVFKPTLPFWYMRLRSIADINEIIHVIIDAETKFINTTNKTTKKNEALEIKR